MVLREKMLPCQSGEAVVTVTSYHNGIMDGYLQHPGLDRKEKIQSLSQMVLLLDNLIDLENYRGRALPAVYLKYRDAGNESRFSVQILFREHYTWQGRLVWQDGRQEYVFRSAIELIQLVDEILAE